MWWREREFGLRLVQMRHIPRGVGILVTPTPNPMQNFTLSGFPQLELGSSHYIVMILSVDVAMYLQITILMSVDLCKACLAADIYM
jgi:hypothetical protein